MKSGASHKAAPETPATASVTPRRLLSGDPVAGTRDPVAGMKDPVAGMKTARTGGVVRAGAVMAVATLVSRATGFLAKVVIVSVLGFGVVNDAYTIANTLPNIIFELLIGGVLTSVAIPLLSRARADPDGGAGYTQRLMTAAVVGLLGATALAIACAPLLTNLYLSGDSATVDQGLANALAYLLLPQIFFYGMAALFAAILNTEEKFGVPAWAPVINNLVVIGVGIALHLMPGSAGAGSGDLGSLSREQFLVLGIGTTFGIVMQAVVMLPALRGIGFRFRWRWRGDRRLLEAGGLALWAVAYVLVSQVGYIVTTNVASANVAGGIAIYAFASMLFQLPYGIIGVSILTAIMPRMSRHAAAGDIENVKDDASLANRLSIVALTPVAAGIAVLASALAIVTSLYGAVDLDESLVLGATLAALIFGLVPFAVTLVQMRVFYAMKDARTPTLINAIMVAVRVPLLIACASLEPTLIVPGLALATAISYLVGAVVGEIWLRVRYGSMHTVRTLITLLKMTVAGVAGAGAVLLVSERVLPLEVDDLGDAVLQLLVGGIVGLLVIAVVTLLLRVEELVPIRRRIGIVLGRVLRRGSTPRNVARVESHRPPEAAGPGAEHALAAEQTLPVLAGAGATADATLPVIAAAAEAAAEETAPVTATPTPVAASAPANAVSGGPRHARDPSGPDQPAWHGTLGGDRPAHAAGADRTDGSGPVSGLVQHSGPTSREHVSVANDTGRTIAAEEVVPGATAGAHAADNHPSPEEPPTIVVSGRDLESLPLHPGATIGGRYRLVSLIAQDSTGHWLWRAKDTVLPRDMAVTILPDDTGASATVARTLRAGRLHHIGLPQTLDVGTESGQSYVVGQWVDGATLTDLLSGGPLDPDVATSITAKVSEAVAEAHRNGIALGAISPSLVRVNFDGQVRLSHVIAHASATPDHDIKAIGALLYLMLTGTWPLPQPVETGQHGPGGRTATLPRAPTRLGRELPAAEVRPEVPEALSALAERALHPEEPDGIHAVGAIAALLRSPENTVGATPPQPPRERPLSVADRRLIKERRVKLSIAAVVLAVFALLIVIALGGLGNQFMASIQNSAPEENLLVDATAPTEGSVPPPTEAAAPEGSVAPTAAEPTAAPVAVVGGRVFDPQGDGNPDYAAYVDRAYDGNPESAWLTWVYKRQFPSLKPGVGLMLELERDVRPSSVVIESATPGTTVEVRSSVQPDVALDATTVIGTGTVGNDPLTIELPADAPTSKYLLVFVTEMSPTSDNQFQAKINEIVVNGI